MIYLRKDSLILMSMDFDRISSSFGSEILEQEVMGKQNYMIHLYRDKAGLNDMD